MKHCFRIFILFVIAMATATSAAATKLAADTTAYGRTERKAIRFRNDAEWLNASAMYSLLLEAKPHLAENYANAIISNAMLGDTLAVVNIMERSMTHNVPIDSVFADVQEISTRLGISYLYEELLIDSAQHFPWMQRGLNSYLLKYYTYRNNGPKMVEYARIMLSGMPESVEFMRLLAKGYLLSDNTEDAVTVWREILANHPDNLPTLLDLGNYYVTTGAMSKARPYLDLANRLNPTPYLADLLRDNK